MSHSLKGSHRIVVNDVSYRWRASGDDGSISVVIWPSKGCGPSIACRFGYHETYDPNAPHGQRISNQIVITNRLVRRVILYSINAESYDPDLAGTQLTIRDIEDKIDWSDAIRARRSN